MPGTPASDRLALGKWHIQNSGYGAIGSGFSGSVWMVGNPSTTSAATSRVRLDANAIVDG
jgi:hypothetical protein